MGGTIHLDDLTFADAIARQNVLQFGLGSTTGSKMNTYEKTVIKNFMNIEYGSGASVEQLIMAYGYFGAAIDRIKVGGFDVPKDLQTAFEACERDLNYKIKEARIKELKDLEAKREQYISAEEKLKKVDEEIARLKELVK